MKMASIKEESEDLMIEEDFTVKLEDVDQQTGSLEKRERTPISESQKELLKACFQEGMKSVGSPLILTAAEATGLPTFVIENWIGNYKRTLKPASAMRPIKPKLHTRDLSPYNLFCRDFLRNKGTLKDIKKRWGSLGEEKRQKYKEEAAMLKAEAKGQQLSPELRELKIKKHLKQLKLEVSSLEQLGVESVILAYDRHQAKIEVQEMSSKGAAGFLDSTDTVNSFALHFNVISPVDSVRKEPVDVLVKRVQDLFNQKYREAGGLGKLPYQSLLNGNITIDALGLPSGIILKKPSFYGRKQLEEVLKAAEMISFHISPDVRIYSPPADPTFENGTVFVSGATFTHYAPSSHSFFSSEDQCPEEPGESCSSEAAVTTADDASYFCSADDEKNALEEWRQWHPCKTCQHWSHLDCGFEKAKSPVVSPRREHVLVKRVQELFNQKYREAGGLGKLPYQSLLNGNITIDALGLPSGIILKKPSFYGRKQLEEVLKAAEMISFHIKDQCPEEPGESCSSEAAVTTADDASDFRIVHVEKETLKEWRACGGCQQWSLLDCEFETSLCVHCQQ
ncbi:hypothetical protein DNTS_016642 [Danionella cerebrum]|uniref:Uncharacterized protein n=1 Tax=Danionella cerebrum TaxID=2873325 RepID=A0A553Q0B0_9TELE|nr:hypothetical protein DNTS_016642 [Danionella translucida]